MFVTFLLAALHIPAGRLVYARAGHIPPFHYARRAGIVTRLDGLSGPPLGVRDSAQYKAFAVDFSGGDRLLAITDGFSEAQNPAGELYGEDRIERFVASLQHPLKRLMNDVRDFESGQPASDDTAAILLSIGAPLPP
jgi:sigma-B regulation protein RsbU (phosphoserine phosphatase)